MRETLEGWEVVEEEGEVDLHQVEVVVEEVEHQHQVEGEEEVGVLPHLVVEGEEVVVEQLPQEEVEVQVEQDWPQH